MAPTVNNRAVAGAALYGVFIKGISVAENMVAMCFSHNGCCWSGSRTARSTGSSGAII